MENKKVVAGLFGEDGENHNLDSRLFFAASEEFHPHTLLHLLNRGFAHFPSCGRVFGDRSSLNLLHTAQGQQFSVSEGQIKFSVRNAGYKVPQNTRFLVP